MSNLVRYSPQHQLVSALLASAIMLGGCQQPGPTPTPAPQPLATVVQPAAPAPVAAVTQPAAPTRTPAVISAPAATPPPTATPSPAGLLALGRQLHRYGDYTNARAAFARVIAESGSNLPLRLAATYDLARSYLADSAYGEALATLEQLDQAIAAEGADPDQFGQKEHFLRAEALMGLARYADAVAAYWRFLDAYPWLAEAVQPRIAAAYLALNDPASAAVAFRRAADVAGDNPSKAYLLEQVAQAHLDAGTYADAAAAYDEILAFAQTPDYRAEIQHLAGQALSAAGDGPGAIVRWQAATAEAPESRYAYLALVELVNRNADFDLFQRGYIDLFAEAYDPAINAFQGYLAAVDPTDERVDNARHRLGQSYLGAGRYAEASAELDRVIAEAPTCDCLGLAYLHKALAQSGLGDDAGARRTYRTFAREHPEDPLAPEALWQSGAQALDAGNQLEAAVDFLALADAFPASERAPQALYALGVGANIKQLYSQSIQALSRLQTNYPDYRWDAVSYWLGRSYAAHGEPDKARAQWQALVARAPDIYYGVLAAFGLQGTPMQDAALLTAIDSVAGPVSRLAGDDGSQAFAESWLAARLTDTVAGAVTGTVTNTLTGALATLPLEVSEDQNLAKGKLLLELDQRGDALVALERVYERNRDNPRALYPLSLEFARLGAYRLSLLAATRLLIRSGANLVEDGPIFFQRLAYPRPFADLIVREAQANDLDPRLYFSLIRQESLFEEGARSSATAQGLAQIVPDTGRWVAERLGHPEYTNELIYRPFINLRFGAYYLDWARDYLDGNLVSALVGYNAGPGNAESWRAQSGPDDTTFVEILSFSEPRVYIQQVTANLYHYARLYR